MGRKIDSALAVLQGLVGDHLARTQNGLETPMAFVRAGEPLVLDALVTASRPNASLTPRLAVLVHGLMSTEAIWELPGGGDYGQLLARDARLTPFYLRYNTGLHIGDNGAMLARRLDELVRAYPVPVEDILLIGHSMGGLVIRSALHEAEATGSRFLPLVRRAIYLGTPHLGAPYERLGRVVSSVLAAIPDPCTRVIADVANVRSAGLRDLGDADLRAEDRERRTAGLRPTDWTHPVPMPSHVRHYLIAGSLVEPPWLRELFGDSVVPVPSALAGATPAEAGGDAVFDAARSSSIRLMPGLSHMMLAHDPAVYEQILAWVVGP